MKQVILIFFLFANHLLFSQLTEGYLQYDIDVAAVDSSTKTKQTVAMLRDSRMELYFTETRSLMIFKMGKMSTTRVVVDREKNQVLSTNEGVMGKVAILSSADEIETIEKDPNATLEFSDETKKILGYTCKKAILHQGELITVYWYTSEIEVAVKDQQILNPNVPGFPMGFSKIENGVRMTFQLSNLREDLTENLDELFSLEVPEGFQLMRK